MTTPLSSSSVPRGVSSGGSAPQSAKRSRAPFRSLTGGGTIRSSGQPAVGSEARRRAAVILEVLAGVHTPTTAAQALGIGAQRYYLLEQQALEGLVQACQPRPHGRTVTSDRQIARLERELAVCRRELGRQQALARRRALRVGAESGHGSSGHCREVRCARERPAGQRRSRKETPEAEAGRAGLAGSPCPAGRGADRRFVYRRCDGGGTKSGR